jgi:hypothetical protein
MKGTRFLRTVSESNAKLRFTPSYRCIVRVCSRVVSFIKKISRRRARIFLPNLSRVACETEIELFRWQFIPISRAFRYVSGPVQEAIDGTKSANRRDRIQKSSHRDRFRTEIRSDIVSLFVFISDGRSPPQIIVFLRNQESNTNGLCYL